MSVACVCVRYTIQCTKDDECEIIIIVNLLDQSSQACEDCICEWMDAFDLFISLSIDDDDLLVKEAKAHRWVIVLQSKKQACGFNFELDSIRIYDTAPSNSTMSHDRFLPVQYARKYTANDRTQPVDVMIVPKICEDSCTQTTRWIERSTW